MTEVEAIRTLGLIIALDGVGITLVLISIAIAIKELK